MNTIKSTLYQFIRRKELLLYILILFAGITLIGWIFNILPLSSFSLRYKPISPLVSITFIILCVLLILTIYYNKSRFLKIISSLLIIFILFYALIILGYFFKFAGYIEEFFFNNLDRFGVSLTGYMSPIAATLFICSAICVLLIKKKDSDISKFIAGSLAILVCFISFVLLTGYLYKAPLLYGSTVIPIALPAAIFFNLFGVTIIRLLNWKYWTFNLIKDNAVTHRILKSFIPLIVFAVILQGFLI